MEVGNLPADVLESLAALFAPLNAEQCVHVAFSALQMALIMDLPIGTYRMGGVLGASSAVALDGLTVTTMTVVY